MRNLRELGSNLPWNRQSVEKELKANAIVLLKEYKDNRAEFITEMEQKLGLAEVFSEIENEYSWKSEKCKNPQVAAIAGYRTINEIQCMSEVEYYGFKVSRIKGRDLQVVTAGFAATRHRNALPQEQRLRVPNRFIVGRNEGNNSAESLLSAMIRVPEDDLSKKEGSTWTTGIKMTDLPFLHKNTEHSSSPKDWMVLINTENEKMRVIREHWLNNDAQMEEIRNALKRTAVHYIRSFK